MTRYSPSKQYFPAAWIALALAAFSAWVGFHWAPALVPTALFVGSSLALFFLASRPPIEIHETRLIIGKRAVNWQDIRRVDRTGWVSPLIVKLTAAGNRRLLIIYPGDLDSANSLLRQLRRFSREALIDGIPYRKFWGEAEGARPAAPAARYPLMRPEDEAEVERLYQQLKTVGRIDPKNTPEEK